MVERTHKKKRLQRTLALIRPNALKKRRDSIIKTIEDSGFLIAMQKEVHLERAQVEELYAEHKDQDYFESLVTNMTWSVVSLILFKGSLFSKSNSKVLILVSRNFILTLFHFKCSKGYK